MVTYFVYEAIFLLMNQEVHDAAHCPHEEVTRHDTFYCMYRFCMIVMQI